MYGGNLVVHFLKEIPWSSLSIIIPFLPPLLLLATNGGVQKMNLNPDLNLHANKMVLCLVAMVTGLWRLIETPFLSYNQWLTNRMPSSRISQDMTE